MFFSSFYRLSLFLAFSFATSISRFHSPPPTAASTAAMTSMPSSSSLNQSALSPHYNLHFFEDYLL